MVPPSSVRLGFDASLEIRTLVLEVERCSALTGPQLDWIRRRLNELGVVILQLLDAPEQHRADLLSLSDLFGSIVPHARSEPDGIAPIEVSDRSPGYMGSSPASHPFHTDGSYQAVPPKVVALHCERPARVGGLTQLASAKRLYDWLSHTDPDVLSALFAGHALTVERQGEVCTQPVFWTEADHIRCRFRADDTAHFGDSRVTRAIGAVRAFLADKKIALTFGLSAGQILVLDNTGVLHGRTAFPPREPRRLSRLAFAGDSDFAASLKFGFTSGGGR